MWVELEKQIIHLYMYSSDNTFIVLKVFDFIKKEIRIYDSLAIYTRIEDSDMELLR